MKQKTIQVPVFKKGDYVRINNKIYIKVHNEDNKAYYQYLTQVIKNFPVYNLKRDEDNKFEEYDINDYFKPSVYTIKVNELPKEDIFNLEDSDIIDSSLLDELELPIENKAVVQITEKNSVDRTRSAFFEISKKDNVYTFNKTETPISSGINIREIQEALPINVAKHYKKENQTFSFENNNSIPLEKAFDEIYQKSNKLQKKILDLFLE